MRHGTCSAYNHGGCRCEACRAANAEWAVSARQRRKERLDADPSLAPHGSDATYVNWLCRCDACVAAMAERNQRNYARRQATLTPPP